MLDLQAPLGRNVATASDVLSVVRSSLRIYRACYVGVMASAGDGLLYVDGNGNLLDGGDNAAETAVFVALLDNAMRDVAEWASDMALVFDKVRTREFVRLAMIAARDPEDNLPAGALDY